MKSVLEKNQKMVGLTSFGKEREIGISVFKKGNSELIDEVL